EALCILNTSAPPAINARKVFALKFSAGPPASLDVMWAKSLAPDATGDVAYTDPFVDLDGDGAFEVVASGKDSSGVGTTHVLDDKTGDELAAISGERVTGTVPFGPGPARALLTTTGTDLRGYIFTKGAAPPLSNVVSQSNQRVLTEPDFDLVGRGG